MAFALALLLGLSHAAITSYSGSSAALKTDEKEPRKVEAMKDENDEMQLANVVELSKEKTQLGATKANSLFQSDVQVDAGALRISPVGEILGHPTKDQRNKCVSALTGAQSRATYSFNCAHKGDSEVNNFITTKAECDASFMLRHRMDDDPALMGVTGRTTSCSLRGEVQYCSWKEDTVACPGSQGGRDCSSEARCAPSGESDFVCPTDSVVLVDCKENAPLTDAEVKRANGWGDAASYGHGTVPDRTSHNGNTGPDAR